MRVSDPLLNVAKVVTQMQRGPLSPSMGSGAGQGITSAPPTLATSYGTDGDGNIYTIHPFILGVDALGDPGAYLV